MLQNIIVGVIVTAALLYFGFTIRKKVKGGGCGCGCSGCGGMKKPEGKAGDIQLPPCCQDKTGL